MICYSQLNKFGQYLFARFRAVLCQQVHPNSNISYFHQFSLWCSALWIFIKTRLRVRKSNFKIFFATSLGSLAVSRPSLVNSFLTDFGGVPSQPVHAESNIRCSRNFSNWLSSLVILKICLRVRKVRVSSSQPIKICKSVFNRLWACSANRYAHNHSRYFWD